MSDEIKVTAIKGFLNGGAIASRGDVVTVTEDRARDLERNGLVTRETKMAAEPKNKMAPKAKNKGKNKGKTRDPDA